jgi:hypothetical protein
MTDENYNSFNQFEELSNSIKKLNEYIKRT